MKRCFGYVRVSTQKQGEGVSLEAQRDAIEAYAQRSDILIIQWFEEKVTAAKKGRPVFNAVIKALLCREAQGLVVHKIDRSARNFADWAKIGDLSDAGIDVHFASESLDFKSRGGRLSADIQAVIAADYIRNLRDETMKGMRGRLKQGLCPWAAPIGYQNNGGGKPKTPDPDVAPYVKRLFELYASGQYSLRTLVPVMRQLGCVTAAGRALSKTAIEAILANPFYCGILKVRSTGETFPGKHEPLISVSLFRAVQQIKQGKYGKKQVRHEFRYRGLFCCASCQFTMTAERQKGHIYYRCHTPGCPTKGVREEAIDAAVTRTLSAFSFTDDDLHALAKWVATTFNLSAIQGERQAAAARVAQTKERLARLVDAFVDQHLDAALFAAKKEALLLDLQHLEAQVASTGTAQETAADAIKFFELVSHIAAAYDFADHDEKRVIIELATSNRLIAPGNVVVEPCSWLQPLKDTLSVASGGPTRPTLRMSIEHLMSGLGDPDSQLSKQFARLDRRATSSRTRAAQGRFLNAT